MDPSQLVAAQCHRNNQLVFDEATHIRAVLQGEKRRAYWRSVPARWWKGFFADGAQKWSHRPRSAKLA